MSTLKKTGSTQAWRKIRQQALERDHHTCQNCGDEGNQVDHIVERRHGGTDDLHNLQTLCVRCHQAKTALITSEMGKTDIYRPKGRFLETKGHPTDSPCGFLSPTRRLSPQTPFEKPAEA